MTQLIVAGIEYPETSHDRYKCYVEDLGESIRMISSRLVTEVRAQIVVIEYSYDYFGDDLMRVCLQSLRSNADLNVQYLAPDKEGMQTGIFRCTKFPSPTYAFSAGGIARWHNVSFKLEEVTGSA